MHFRSEKNIHIYAFIVIFLVVFINLLPRFFIYAQYDVTQIYLTRRLFEIMFLWNREGLGYRTNFASALPYYLPLTALPTILHTAYYYLIFLIPTYLGIAYFYGATRNIGIKPNKKLTIFLVAAYTLSFFPVYSFYFQGGHFPFHNLYSLFPPIFILFYLYIQPTDQLQITKDKLQIEKLSVQEKVKLVIRNLKFVISPNHQSSIINYQLYILLAILFLTNIVNSNIPYFFSLNLVLLAIATINYAIHKSHKNIRTAPYLAKLAKFYLLYFLIIFWSVVPQVAEQFRAYQSHMSSQQLYQLDNWLFWQSMNFTSVWTMFWETRRYLDKIPLTVYGALSITLLAFIALIATKKKTGQKTEPLTTILWTTYIFVIFLANKGAYWLPQSWTLAIFKLPFLAPLRSYDKTLIFMPFILFAIISIYILTNYKQNRRLKQAMLAVLCISQIIASYPLWSGQLVTKYSDQHERGEDYTTAKYSPVVKIPDDYHEVAQILNTKYDEGKNQFRILRLPYSVVNSPGWANYPKWKVNSADPTVQLFQMPTIQPCNFPDEAFGLWNWGQEWNTQGPEESRWMLDFMTLTNARYIIYHKDVRPDFVAESIEKIAYYEQNGWITQIYVGEYIEVYELSEAYWGSHFYISDDTPVVVARQTRSNSSNKSVQNNIFNPEQTSYDIRNSQFVIRNLDFEYLSPVKYKITVEKPPSEPFLLVFSESFHTGWRLTGATNEHKRVHEYANGWIIDSEGRQELELTLEFMPQRLYWLGAGISSLTFLWVLYKICSLKRRQDLSLK